MDTSTTLLELLRGSDPQQAANFLDEHPEAALGRGPQGESLILWAIYAGRPELGARIAGVADVDLCEAAALGDETRAEVLMARGHSPENRSTDGWTPLHLAAFTGPAAVARVLLTRGATVDAVSSNGMANSPLCAALAGRGSVDVVQLLLDARADVNFRAALGVTPLHLAASRGADPLVRLLLERGADASARMDDGTTPASIAASRGHAATAAALERVST
jgi:uncharacterized protein